MPFHRAGIDRRKIFSSNHFPPTPPGDSESSAIADHLIHTREAWLEHGLDTRRADRTTTEAAISDLYRIAKNPPPQFIWESSPHAAVRSIRTEKLDTTTAPGRDDAPNRIAAMLARSRDAVEKRLDRLTPAFPNARATAGHTRALSPAEALESGADVVDVIRETIRDSLRTSLFDNIGRPIKSTLPVMPGVGTWFGQHEAHRSAFGLVVHRWGLVRLPPDEVELLEITTALAVSAGWWWAFDDVCVLAERPVSVSTEPIPYSPHGTRRLHSDDGRAVAYADGCAVHAIHGTIVPQWVIDDPTPERIAAERNIEIRRTAIERIGWDRWIDDAGMQLIDESDDPGNEAATLTLYASPRQWRTNQRILVVTNGSRERDGRRRRYGIHVPGWVPTALTAAAWTYGLDAADYAQLVRRT
ncbi:hypothetical protein J6U32_05525 [Gordonia polyisoprenivorans]|nr:hypothetical protein J6U32_05525 [Gordonia polyisoprenivorans]